MRRVISHRRDLVVNEYYRIAQMLAGSAPVLDLGCGAGTLLESCKELGIEARGVDASPLAVQACLDRGLLAVEGDLFAHLNDTSSGSVGSVFAGHVIEHLPVEQAETLFEHVGRVLRSSGRFLALTPNPRNLYVAGEGFWMDPTHVRPYPRPLLHALAVKAGFKWIRVDRWFTGMPLRQRVMGVLRWGLTGGLHDPAPALLLTAVR